MYLGLDSQGKRLWKRECRICGKTFITKATNAFNCRKCQREHRKLRKRECQRKLRNTEGVYLGNRTWKRQCRKCGGDFITTGSHKFYCDECQRVRDLLSNRRKNRRYRRKVRYDEIRTTRVGTFGEKYLELYRGRIRGAVLLEKRIAINSRHYYRIRGQWYASKGYVGYYGVSYLMATCKEKIYCNECGAEIIIARENDIYTATELCCKSCGLVYELT